MRESGLLVPFRSLPGESDHQGTLGEDSYQFLDLMQRTGFTILHDLPNTPPDEFNCPYSSISAFALDVQRIDLLQLAKSGDLGRIDLNHYQHLVSSGSAGPDIKAEKEALLSRAFVNFEADASSERQQALKAWSRSESEWLEPYAVFEILKKLPENVGKPWQEWSVGKNFSPGLVQEVKKVYSEEFAATCYKQWTAHDQTIRYLQAAERMGIEVWGDVPFYVGDGEVWANRDIFNLDENGYKITQGGAAPSDTSATGQVWGNATYKIGADQHPESTVKAIDWWTRRLARATEVNNGRVRLDHFIGFAEPYIIDGSASDGSRGWREEGVGKALFDRLQVLHGGQLPFYPEDLGTMTHKTPELRDSYGFLSNSLAVRALTKDLLCGRFENSRNNPDNYHPGVIGFSGNHDSPTIVQALDKIRTEHPEAYAHYLRHLNLQSPHYELRPEAPTHEVAQREVERVIHSMGQYAIIGIWDILRLGAEGRYNVPGTVSERNWSWRMSPDDIRTIEQDAKRWQCVNESGRRSLRAAS